MSKFCIDVTCVRCGAGVEHVTSNIFQSDQRDTRSGLVNDTAVTVVQCVNPKCRRQWFIRAVMMEGPVSDGAIKKSAQRQRESETVSF